MARLVLGDDGRACGWPDQAQQHAQCGRFPGPVGSQEPEDLAAMDLEVERVDGRDRRAVSLRQAVGRNDVSICHWHLLHKRTVPFTVGVKRLGVVTTAPDLWVRCEGEGSSTPWVSQAAPGLISPIS